jgi:glutamate-1-semialdehyde 2,1-aminomutase
MDTNYFLLNVGILAAAKEHGHAACGGNISGMYGFFFTAGM